MLVDLQSDVRTRHLIHLTLHLTLWNNGRLFTEEEKSRFQTPGIHSDLCFHFPRSTNSHPTGYAEMQYIVFTGIAGLYRFTFRIPFTI